MWINRFRDERIGMLRCIHQNGVVDVFGEYCKKNRIKAISSYDNQKAIQIDTVIDRNIIGIRAIIDVSDKFCDGEKNFVMILLKYIPKSNMAYYYRKGYSLAFDIKSDKGVCGMQLEVKDIAANKVMDEYVSVSKELRHYSFKLRDYSEIASWKEINEICFTFFLEKDYLTKDKGKVFISNCKLLMQ